MDLTTIVTKEQISRIQWNTIRLPEYFLIEVELSTKVASIYECECECEPTRIVLKPYSQGSAQISGKNGTYSRNDLPKAVLTRIGQEELMSSKIVFIGTPNYSEIKLYERRTPK